MFDYLIYWLVSSMLIWAPLLLLLILSTPNLRILGIFYLIWMYIDRDSCHTGNRRLKFLRKLKFWRYRRDYFPITLVKTADLPPNTTYLFSCFPHGLSAFGATTNFVCDINRFDEEFPGLNPYIMTMNGIFRIPFCRELLMAFGARAVSKEGISHVLRGSLGNVSVVMVGGLAEAFKSSSSGYILILKNRKGFVKIALETGSALVPVFSFGETDTFDQISEKWYRWMPKELKNIVGFIFLLLFNGQGILPYQKPITTVVGEPIKLPKVEVPSNELVDKYHEIFVNKLVELFEENKIKYDSRGEKATLIIE